MANLARITRKHMEEEETGGTGELLRQTILGGQDGLVNVLGIVLGVAAATSDARMVLVAGFAAAFAESVSMAAVAYTSTRAEQDHYRRMLAVEKYEMENLPDIEREEIRMIYRKKGFWGKDLERVVKVITGNKKMWLDVMMKEELGLVDVGGIKPKNEALVVGVSSFIGSLLPLLAFLVLPISSAFFAAIAISLVILFAAGMVKGKLTTGKILHDGVEMAV
ncbi:hypothetical protein COV61_05160, partial [Candidatus Micrarchaeota archaeon CG11_big_fil_rev_8_21_14_0_20_47_5]